MLVFVHFLNISIKSSRIVNALVTSLAHQSVTPFVDFVGGALGLAQLLVELVIVHHDGVDWGEATRAFFPCSRAEKRI